MKLEWDFSDFTNFASRLGDTHEFESALMTATQNVAKVLHHYLINATPIKTGNLRKMWSAGDNLAFTVEPFEHGYQVTFINTARADHKDGFMYGVAVNDGHRTPDGGGWVMGRFFVEKAIVQTSDNDRLASLIMAPLRKWWKGCLNGK